MCMLCARAKFDCSWASPDAAPNPNTSWSFDDLAIAPAASAEFEALLFTAAPGWNGANNLPQVVSYSFGETRPAPSFFLNEGWQPFSSVQRASTREALSRWDNASGIVFVEVPDPGDDALVDLRFHLADFNESLAGRGAYPFSGTIWMNRTYYRDDPLASGSFGFHVLMHEIGHAIGFKHPFQGAKTLSRESDNTTRTVMSYTNTSSNTDIGDIDRAAAIHVYGEQSAQPTWVSNAIWSNAHQAVLQQGSAGADAIRGTTGSDVLLGEAGQDSLVGLGGDDQLWGGEGSDTLIGGAGDDELVGGAGVDTATFTFSTHSHRFSEADGLLLVDGSEGADVLSGVENLIFGGVSHTMTSLRATASIATLSYAQAGSGLTASKTAIAYSGTVETLRFQYLGSNLDQAVAGTVSNDFINALGGDDAVNGGRGSDVIDGGTGSNFLTGGPGLDTFFLDGRGGTNTWGTITDWQLREQVSIWGFRPGVSRLHWVDQDGTEGYRGVTLHADLDASGLIDTSVTWTGLAREALPTPREYDGLLWFSW
ncbi:MAG: hypothetical protein ING24_00505 [Roseomonas sp.]|nr:hypothetical protein [Roseomonas sp.]MCA3340908.1 hypothetical protein [Roseomonas sp.]